MNWRVWCCCLYLYSGTKSEEDAPLDNERSGHKAFNFIGSVVSWTREKRKVKAGSTHDHLHHTLGREVGDTSCQHVYARPTQSVVEGNNAAATESVSLVQKIVGNRLYKTFEKNNRQRNSRAAPPPYEQGQESPFDSFEGTESYQREVTAMPSYHMTGSLTNRNPRVVSEYQNVPHHCLPPQADYRYPDNRRVTQPNIPPPPPRCYYNQPIIDKRGFQPIDSRRQIKTFQ